MAMSSTASTRWFYGAIWRGRSTRSVSRNKVTIWRAPVSSTVAYRRASEQTWIMGAMAKRFFCLIYDAGLWRLPIFGKFFDSLAQACLGGAGRPGRQIVALERGGKLRRRAKEPARLGGLEAGQPRGLQKGGGAVGRLDQAL